MITYADCYLRVSNNLSPLLFALFINDMEDFLFLHGSESIKIFDSQKDITLLKTILLLYADDTVIIAESAADLQHSLDGLNLYCTAWNLKVNITKTKVVIFSKSSCKNKVTELNTPIELVESLLLQIAI